MYTFQHSSMKATDSVNAIPYGHASKLLLETPCAF